MSKDNLHINLSDFIEKTIVEVISGVKNAGEKFAGEESRFFDNSYSSTLLRFGPQAKTKDIEFDLSITAEKALEKEGGAGIKINVVKVGASAKSADNAQETARIKFSVPVFLPETPEK